MRFKSKLPLSVGFISLGCAKNLVDSEVLAANVLRGGFRLARVPEKADIIIVNTCAFITDAKKESIDAIFNACALKRRGTTVLIIVAGCLPQRYRDEIRSLFPEVDAFIGVDQVSGVSSVIRRLLKGRRGIVEISRSPRAIVNPPPGRPLFTGAPYAYLKIAEGCDHRCTYCAIPQIRGRYRSRAAVNIVKEAERHLEAGVRELNLVAQDVTSYGHDLGGKNTLPDLLRRIGRIGGKFWIRLLYAHPDHVGDDLLAAVAEIPQVCRYLDLPIQHCSGKILRLMGRRGSEDELRKLFAGIRNVLPDITLRTTCIAGFPGETENDFGRLRNFIEETVFDHLGVFVFSEEEGTKAAGLARKVAPPLARRRKDVLMRTQQKIVARKLAEAIGSIEEVLVEKPEGRRTWLARSRRQAADVDNAVYLRDYAGRYGPGMFVKVRYTAAKGYDLIAEIEERDAYLVKREASENTNDVSRGTLHIQ